MSEQARLIPKVPPIESPDSKAVENTIPPEGAAANIPSNRPVEITSTNVASTSEGSVGAGTAVTGSPIASNQSIAVETSGLPESSQDSITLFQGVTYASFILTFCLAGFAAVVVFRKALKTSVRRFSMSAKTLSSAYLVIAFVGSFGTYIYSRFLNGSDTPFSLIIPMLAWLFVGPAIAVALSSLLNREDKPEVKKILFDAFNYIVIFGCVIASQVPSIGTKESLVFSFLGAFFYIFPIIRYSTSLKVAKTFHTELQEMFIQILIRILLFYPLLIPSLVFSNACSLISDDLTLLLFNLVTFVFVLMTCLLMVISIDYITQGISADQLVSGEAKTPVGPSDSKSDQPSAQSAKVDQPAIPVSTDHPASSKPQETIKPIPQKTAKPKLSDVLTTANKPEALAPPEVEDIPNNPTPIEESLDTFDFDVEKHDSTVIDFDTAKSSTEISGKGDSDTSLRKKSNPRPPGLKPKMAKEAKSPQKPKAPKSPNTSKSSDSKSRFKPPEKPKKRF